MKYLILIHSLTAGGAERVSVSLANHWVSNGDDVTVATISSAAKDFYELDSRVRRVPLCLDGKSQGGFNAFRNNVKRILAIRRVLREEGADVAIGMMTTVGILLTIASVGLRRSKVIVSEHNYPPMKPIGKVWASLRKWVYPHADGVTMLTSEGLSWLATNVPSATGVVMPNPFNYPIASVSPHLDPGAVVASDKKVLLAVGSLTDQKGFDYLVEAFSKLSARYESWHLVILGEGQLRPALEAMVERLDLCDRVSMPGRAGNIGDWYKRADVYVMSSRYEGFPMTLGEAMSYGCAVVSFDCDTGPRDLIEDGVNGVLVTPPGDPDSLATELSKVMEDESLRKRLGASSISVKDMFSTTSVAGRWSEFIKGI